MKDKLNKLVKNRSQSSLTLWLIAGGYLVYLAYQILTGDQGSTNRLIIYATSALFIIVGLALVGVSLYALIGKHYQIPQPQEDNSEENEQDQ